MDERIRQGRDPEWQLAFQDRLDEAARARVRRAVHTGVSLPDPNEAAIAAGLAHREQRMLLCQMLIVLPLQVGLVLTWLRLLLPPMLLSTGFRWLWAALLTVLVGVVPCMFWRRYRSTRRAVGANGRPARPWDDDRAPPYPPREGPKA
jgi:hypothetical protein